MQGYIDIHCHLTGDEYAPLGGVDGVLALARENGVERIVCSGFDLASSKTAQELAGRYNEVYFCAGYHPSELNKYQDGDLEQIRMLCQDKKCIAVGEIGLDYHFEDNPPKDMQRDMFIRQLQLAYDVHLPVVIHSRDAAQDTLELLQAHKTLLGNGGLMHCYSYSPEMAAAFSALGLSFSFGGPCTFKNAHKVVESIARIEKTRLLSETDCPYLTPVPRRGEFPNHPSMVRFAVAKMAEIKQIDEIEMKNQIRENAKRLFPRLHEK